MDALKLVKCARVCEKKASGAKAERPARKRIDAQ
jgi:hypothetical protein